MMEDNHRESRKLAREFIQSFEKTAWIYIGSKPEKLVQLYNEASAKAEEYKNHPHYLIALVRTPWRFRGILPDYVKNYEQVTKLMTSVYGEEKTKQFLVGMRPGE